MRRDRVNKSTPQLDRSALRCSPQVNLIRSDVIAPVQMHQLLTSCRASARSTIGTELDLGIEIAESFGPIPRDYAHLMLEILCECVKHIGDRGNDPPSVEIRLSEVTINAQVTFAVLEVRSRNLEPIRPGTLSKKLLNLRDRIEELNGFLVNDNAFRDKSVFRVALPIVSICS
jgi:hypothetical protein